MIERLKQQLENVNDKTVIGKLDKIILQTKVDNYYKPNTIAEYKTYTKDNIRQIDLSKPTRYKRAIDTKRLILNSGLDKAVDRYKFDNFDKTKDFQKHIYDKAIKYVTTPKGLFFISGMSGAGKTHIATAIATRLMFNGKQVKYMKWVEEKETIKSIDYELGVKKLQEIGNAEVLYIDDFLKSDLRKKPTPADIERAFAIIDNRDVKDLPTIISTEMTYKQIEELDVALANRLVEMADTEAENYFIEISYKADRNYRKNFLPKAV